MGRRRIRTGLFSAVFVLPLVVLQLVILLPLNNPSSVVVVHAMTISRVQQHHHHHSRRPKSLPPKLLIGYATDSSSEKVLRAVRQGCNVLIWSFLELQYDDDDMKLETNSLDLDEIRAIQEQLDAEGLGDTLHLSSFGGWNGPHLDITSRIIDHGGPEVWYRFWKEKLGTVFDGLDWDLEGHDDLQSPTNTFSLKCLDWMGEISRLAKQDGYIVGMAPPQSYLCLLYTSPSPRD